MNASKQLVFQRITPNRVIDNIADQIKGMIYSKSLLPDDRLPSEKELAASFGTGRMTVREALRMLEAIGLIYIKQGSEGGAFVKKLDASTLTLSIEGLLGVGNVSLPEITDARIAIECLLLESAIENAAEKHFNLLQENIDQCQREHVLSQTKRAPSKLPDFHNLLAEPSDNHLLKYFLHALVELSNHYIQQNTPDLPLSPTHIAEHETIFRHFKSRNIEASREILKTHLIASASHIDLAVQIKKKIA